MRYGHRFAVILLATLGASAVSAAAEYRFEFAPGSSQFEPDRAANAAALRALVPLLLDYHDVPALSFVLVGALAADCQGDCPSRALLRRRVESLTARLAADPRGGAIVADLQWQPMIAPAAQSAETLSLRTRSAPPSAWSERCPYRVSISDPRLPPPIDPLAADPQWIAVNASAAIPVAAHTALRVRLEPPPTGPVPVDAVERLADQSWPLSSGPGQAEWSGANLHWRDDTAEIEIRSGLRPRDIGNLILPDDAEATSSTANNEVSTVCRLRLLNRPPPATSESH